ncbi:MAG: glutathione S-transferase family protein [Alphaproteobacteria bacterium]|nr:glutathione S-transferase family protein [Alphaproteobacteria bacterium]
MILIGQYDSPFVRRVGIALRLHDLAFEHRPWSVFGDADKLRPINPLLRVPTLITDDGAVLTDSGAILDFLDGLVPAERALVPRAGVARREALRVAALATGMGEKAVALFYELRMHDKPALEWVERVRSQVRGAAAALEVDGAVRAGPFWFGERIGHADIAVAAMWRFIGEAHPGLLDPARHPALVAHAARCEALPVFREIAQAFVPPP